DHYGASPLHWAAMYGGAETVSVLLDRGLAIDAETDFGETPLALAALAPGHDMPARTDRTPVIELLRRRGARVDVFATAALGDAEALSALLDADPGLARATNRFDSTSLHYAAWAGHADATRLLLDRGADVDAFDRHGMPPLLYAAYWGRHEATVEMLLDSGAGVYWKNIWGKGLSAYDAIFDHNHWLARKGGSAVHDAALTGDVLRLRSLLDEDSDRVGERSQSSATPLHFAASGNQVPAIRLLLDAGADIEAKMDRGISPLYSAARAGAAEAVALLIARGADVMSAGTAWQAWTPLHGTTKSRGNRVEVARMLLDAGADVDSASPWGGITPMYATVIEADLEKAQLLIARGADINHKITIWQKDSLLHTVANRPEIPVEGAVAMIELLIAAGADVNATDDAGHTPLQVAAHAECAEALRRNGAV
ncbi:MAG: ankyrin repeat domain-containing protein, partial [Acidobacteria bacterium]|nr:ankyrin repeat domain-containing protein [Acidobacteriota bacterium]